MYRRDASRLGRETLPKFARRETNASHLRRETRLQCWLLLATSLLQRWLAIREFYNSSLLCFNFSLLNFALFFVPLPTQRQQEAHRRQEIPNPKLTDAVLVLHDGCQEYDGQSLLQPS